MTEHFRFGGSGADRYINCAGSTALIDTIPKPPSSRYADEGSAAHHLASLCLQKNDHPSTYLDEVFDEWPAHPVTQNMVDAVVVYLNAVTAEQAKTKDAQLYVEQRVELDIEGAEGEVGGTLDALVYHPKLGRLVVFDYKHGVGVSVTADDNAQLKFYASLAVFSHPDWSIKDLELVIVQPRAGDVDELGAVRSWPMDSLDLMDFQADLEDAISTAKMVDDVQGDGQDGPLLITALKTGKWCRWCDAAALCPLRQKETLEALTLDAFGDIEEIRTDTLPDVKSLDTDRLSKIVAGLSILQGWANQAQEYLEALLLGGTPVEGWKVVNKIGRAKWIAADQDVVNYADLQFGIPEDTIHPRKLVTITEAEKLLKAAGATKEDIEDFKLKFTLKESSGLTIAPSSDRRPAANPLADFGSVDISI